MLRAVLEGVAHGRRDGLDLIGRSDPLPSFARGSGGGARSRSGVESSPPSCSLPLDVLESEAGGAYGAALLGGQASGAYDEPAAVVASSLKVAATYESRIRAGLSHLESADETAPFPLKQPSPKSLADRPIHAAEQALAEVRPRR